MPSISRYVLLKSYKKNFLLYFILLYSTTVDLTHIPFQNTLHSYQSFQLTVAWMSNPSTVLSFFSRTIRAITRRKTFRNCRFRPIERYLIFRDFGEWKKTYGGLSRLCSAIWEKSTCDRYYRRSRARSVCARSSRLPSNFAPTRWDFRARHLSFFPRSDVNSISTQGLLNHCYSFVSEINVFNAARFLQIVSNDCWTWTLITIF